MTLQLNVIRLFIGLILSIVLWSCSEKECCEPPPANSTPLVKSLTLSYDPGLGIPDVSTFYYYDTYSNLKLTKVSLGDSIINEYAGNQIFERRYNLQGLLHTTNIFYLNDRGLVDSTVENNWTKYTRAKYDQDGYLTELKSYDVNRNLLSIQQHQIMGGNVVISQTKDVLGNLIFSQINDFSGSVNNSISNANIGQSFRGRSSRQVATKVIYTDHVLMHSDTFIYEFILNTKGLIETVKYHTGNVTTVGQYTYFE